MLTLTENACNVVKTITEQTTDNDDAGVRISSEGDASALSLAAVDAPQPGDKVVEEAGARVFLDEQAATTLDQQVLDAQVDQEGGVQFALGAQT